MKNAILRSNPGESSSDPNPGRGPLADRSASRALASRREAHADAVDRLVAASFALIAESGDLEPRVSEIVSPSR